MSQLSSRIVKGGAALADTRRLVDVWRADLTVAENAARILDGNLLGKRSRQRAQETLDLVLIPRFVAPGEQVLSALRALEPMPAAFREACCYEAMRCDELLAAFAEDALFAWYQAGRSRVTTADTGAWLTALVAAGRLPQWGDALRDRVARGLLATVRDFGILEGAVNKRFAPPRMTPTGFAYVAFREHDAGRSSRVLMEGTLWRRWLLDRARVDELFGMAERLGVLRYHRAGSAVRIDWRIERLEEVAHAAA